MKSIVSHDGVRSFIESALDLKLCPPCSFMGLEQDGRIIAAVAFNVFEGHDLHFSAAGCGWNKKFLSEVGRYVFDVLGCQRMTAVTESAEVARLAQRLGGQIEGCLRNHFGPDRNAYIVGILAKEYKFWNNMH